LRMRLNKYDFNYEEEIQWLKKLTQTFI
jgi:hypothetical protein